MCNTHLQPTLFGCANFRHFPTSVLCIFKTEVLCNVGHARNYFGVNGGDNGKCAAAIWFNVERDDRIDTARTQQHN